MRWAWIGLAIVSAIGYLWMYPMIELVELSDGEEGGGTKSEKDGEVENLEEDEELDEEEVLVATEA